MLREPTDPEKRLLFHRFLGANIALKGIHDTLSEIQVFTLSQLWPEGSKELDAVADAVEAIKAVVATRNSQIVDAAGRLMEDGPEKK